MNSKGDTFPMLVSAGVAAINRGDFAKADFEKLAFKALCFSTAACDSPDATMSCVEAASRAGLDWKAMATPGGQGLLGYCLRNHSNHGVGDEIGSRLVQLGADPQGRCIEESLGRYGRKKKSDPKVTCLDFHLGIEGGAWWSHGKTAKAILDSMPDDGFMSKMRESISQWSRSTLEGFCSKPGNAMKGALDRYAALEEAAKIGEATGLAPKSKAKPGI